MRCWSLAKIAGLSFMLTAPARAELIHGFADLSNGGVDFSLQQSDIVDHVSGADIFLAVVDPPGGYFIMACENTSALSFVHGVTLEQITEAPEDLSAYECFAGAAWNAAYIIRTADGLFAKLAFDDWNQGEYFPNRWTIEYFVQTDGSRDLDSTTLVSLPKIHRPHYI